MADQVDIVFTDLPVEIHLHILSFLHVCDILRLGCSCRVLFKLTQLNVLWKYCFKSNTDHILGSFYNSTCSEKDGDLLEVKDGFWKEMYLKASYALSFSRGGTVVDIKPKEGRNYGNINVLFGREQESRSVELWVKVNPDKPDGVIIGCQSESTHRPRWPQYHWQVMHVGPDGCIRGAIRPYFLLTGPMINDNKWHHIALLAFGSRHVCMYVDGELVSAYNDPDESYVPETNHSSLMPFCQLGTGCISYGELTPYDSGAMPSGHCGWYPFHGSIREVRFWSGTLSQRDIKKRMYLQRIDLIKDMTGPCQLIGYWPFSKLLQDGILEPSSNTTKLQAVILQNQIKQSPLKLSRIFPPR